MRTDAELELVGWTREEYDRLCAEQQLAAYDKEQRQLCAGYFEPYVSPGRTYRRVTEYGLTEQMEAWK